MKEEIYLTPGPAYTLKTSFRPSPFGENIFATYTSLLCSRNNAMTSSSIDPSTGVTLSEYVVVRIGATACVKHPGQSGFIKPVHTTDARESNGTFTTA